MKILKQALVIIGVFLLWVIPVRAEITPQLLTELSRQPSNVQANIQSQHTNIYVVDQLPWTSADLADTYAYTTMNVSNGSVSSIDIYIKRGCEFALTHEIGHVISNTSEVYGWCYQPSFIAIWNAEKYNNALLVGQGENDVREYFASAYDLYIRFPMILKQANPQTYNYITVVLNYT